ncbi:hypothetical protein H7U18_25925 [Klebsiella pneumoniae]|uniref:Uncharacterized protein n=1 Tax=Klebsiella pneumoniae TaxID=573 RepID=A0A923ENT7_KLEPN|nr:hypothetical protein [Klebsiella pneumoniae]
MGRVASGKGAAAFGIVPLAVNVQIAGDCHGGNLLFCGSPVYRAALTGSVSRAVIAHFLQEFCVAHNTPKPSGVKAAQRRLNQQIPRVLHKVIAIDYLPPSGAVLLLLFL